MGESGAFRITSGTVVLYIVFDPPKGNPRTGGE
jgi:hypothetical protein